MNLLTRIHRRFQYALELKFNLLFERWLGIDSDFIKRPECSLENQQLLQHAQRYHPSNYWPIIWSLRFLQKRYQQRTLVDLGCGAGRVLITGAALGFDALYGVDIDADLIKGCCRNVEQYQRKRQNRARFQVEVKSAAEVDLQSSDCTVFLFNPFDDFIFSQFLDRNAKRLSDGQASFVLINPRLHHLLVEIGYTPVRVWEKADFSRSWRVYRKQLRSPERGS